MKKYRCKCEYSECEVNSIKEHYIPEYCPYYYSNVKINWQEVKEEIKEEVKAEELPSWCKVGEVVYFTKLSKYCKILDIDTEKGIKIQTDLSNGWAENFYDLQEARIRPFNEQEMRFLVGKVIENNHNAHLVIGLIKQDPAENVSCFVRAGQSWIAPDKLLQNYTLDSKPCGVYEHKENGEWVE